MLTLVLAMQSQMKSVQVEDFVVSLRRQFHQKPELSFHEEETSRKIQEELGKLGLSFHKVGSTGVVCDITGKTEGKIVALRADMDALPVVEENNVPYVSQDKGIMHACGHDSHIAMLLGAAKLFVQNKDHFSGTVRLLFQAAEEAPPGGAIDFINAGELKDVSSIIGQHVTSLIPKGSVACYPGKAMANADEFRIKIVGKGGHGSEPQNAIDSIVIGAEFVTQAQTIVSRMVPAFNPAVMTIGTFNSGYRYNIIAPYAEMTGTVRTFDVEIREKVKTALENILSGLCSAYGATYEYEFIEGYPVVVNDSKINEVVENVAASVLGREHVLHLDPIMGGEDFAYYLREVPGAFYFLGTGNADRGISSPNHSPTFDIDEDAMKYGVEILYQSTLRLLSD